MHARDPEAKYGIVGQCRKSFVFDTPGVPFLIDLQAPQILVSFLIHLRQSHVFANTQKSIQCTTIYGYM